MVWQSYCYNAFKVNLNCVVLFNGWPVHVGPEAEGGTYHAKLNPFLFEDEVNRLEIFLSRCPEEQRTPEQEIYRSAMLKVPEDANPDDVEEYFMVTYQHHEEETPLDVDQHKPVFEHRFSARKAYGRWSWQDAKLYMDDQKPDVFRIIQLIYDTIAARDVPGLVKLMQLQLQEVGRAMEIPEIDHVQKAETGYRSFLDDPGFRLLPLDMQRLRLESASGGRLLNVLGPDGGAPIQGFGEDGRPFRFSFVLSNLPGGWQIVR